MLNSVLIFLDFSAGHLLVIAIVALLVLGPQKMGDLARKAGKMVNEVKRVSSDFTSQLNQETGGLQDELRSVKDSLMGAVDNIKEEISKQEQDIKKGLDPNLNQDINESSKDIYNLSKDSSVKDSQPESNIEGLSSEHSGSEHVSIDELADKNPTPKQENTTNP